MCHLVVMAVNVDADHEFASLRASKHRVAAQIARNVKISPSAAPHSAQVPKLQTYTSLESARSNRARVRPISTTHELDFGARGPTRGLGINAGPSLGGSSSPAWDI